MAAVYFALGPFTNSSAGIIDEHVFVSGEVGATSCEVGGITATSHPISPAPRCLSDPAAAGASYRGCITAEGFSSVIEENS